MDFRWWKALRLSGLALVAGSLFIACAPASPTAAPTPLDSSVPSVSAPAVPIPPGQPQTAQAARLGWERVSIAGPGPGLRKDATLVYASTGNSLLLFGGRQGGQGLNDLWSFSLDTGRWSQIAAAAAPAPRWGHVAVFDDQRRQLVVFSGQGPGGFFNDTWVFDMASQGWRETTPAGDKPASRYGSCVGYDRDRDLLYISHGFASGRFNDTWAFDLKAQLWSDVSARGVRPIERCLHQCAFDADSRSLLLYGGQSNVTPILGDLWRYDPSSKTWREVSPAGQKPLPRFFSSLVGDLSSQRFLLFGGVTTDGRKNDLWSYGQKAGWAKLAVSGIGPEARSNHSGAFVPATKSLYIFGGTGEGELGDLWRLSPG